MEQRREEIISWIVRVGGGTLLKGALEWQAVYGVMLEAASLLYAAPQGEVNARLELRALSRREPSAGNPTSQSIS